MNILVLRWLDNDGKQHTKEYPAHESRQARKAMKWLVDNGAKEVDLAIRVKTRNTSA
jgi:hypothetical protein